MALIDFTEQDYPLLVQWIDSEELNYLWGGPGYHYPLTGQQIAQHCQQPEVSPFLFCVDQKPAGFVELFQVSPTEARICRVFIAPEFRGKGYSPQMLESLIHTAKTDKKLKTLTLAVFEHNQSAIASYTSLGFSIYQRESSFTSEQHPFFNDKHWHLLRMKKSL